MKRFIPLLAACICGMACLSALVSGPSVAADEAPLLPKGAVFQAGFSERDITPDFGMEAPGGYGKATHASFHDACKVRAAVFDDGKKRVALVGLDLLFISRHLVLEARKEIQQRCGIPADCVLIGASHSHSSGPIGVGEPGDFDQASPFVKDLAENKTITSNPGYNKLLVKQMTDAVVQADGAKTPAKLAAGFAHEDKVSFNRRLTLRFKPFNWGRWRSFPILRNTSSSMVWTSKRVANFHSPSLSN